MAIKAYRSGNPRAATVGTCVVFCIVKDNKIYVANCGDTQACLFSHLEKDFKSKLEGKYLGNIHNASQQEEQKKLLSNHSNENDILLSKKESNVYYVKGMLQCTRVKILLNI